MLPLVLSSDSHVFEQPDLWQTRIDRTFRDRAPRIERIEGGDLVVVEADQILSGIGLISNAGVRFEAPETISPQGRFEDVLRGGYDPEQHLRDMALDGVAGEVLYPSQGLFTSRWRTPADVRDRSRGGVSARAFRFGQGANPFSRHPARREPRRRSRDEPRMAAGPPGSRERFELEIGDDDLIGQGGRRRRVLRRRLRRDIPDPAIPQVQVEPLAVGGRDIRVLIVVRLPRKARRTGQCRKTEAAIILLEGDRADSTDRHNTIFVGLSGDTGDRPRVASQ